ncbi:hypothetical protein ACJX0J_005748, partial [Zea mays]
LLVFYLFFMPNYLHDILDVIHLFTCFCERAYGREKKTILRIFIDGLTAEDIWVFGMRLKKINGCCLFLYSFTSPVSEV